MFLCCISLHRFLFYANLYGSIMFLCCISLHRFLFYANLYGSIMFLWCISLHRFLFYANLYGSIMFLWCISLHRFLFYANLYGSIMFLCCISLHRFLFYANLYGSIMFLCCISLHRFLFYANLYGSIMFLCCISLHRFLFYANLYGSIMFLCCISLHRFLFYANLYGSIMFLCCISLHRFLFYANLYGSIMFLCCIRLHRFLFYANLYGSIMFLCCISLHRFLFYANLYGSIMFLCCISLHRFLFYANLYGSIMFLCCISLHRFLGVCYPMRSLCWVTARRARLVSVAVWACLLMCQAPMLYFSRTRDDGTERVCFTSSPELFNDFLVYSSVVSVLMFAFPFMVVMVCYGMMVRKLLEPSLGAGGSQSRGAGGLNAHRSKQKYVKMIIIVLAVFMLCFLPFHLTRSLYYFLRYLEQMDPSQVSCELLKASSLAYEVTRPLASANSCVDPIIYFMAGQGFRSNLTNKSRASPRKPGSVTAALKTRLEGQSMY